MEHTNSTVIVSKEKAFEALGILGDDLVRLLIRWGGWLLVIIFLAIVRACYEYIKGDGKVAFIRLCVLFVMTIFSGFIGIFIVSNIELPQWANASIVIVVSLTSFRLIDALLSIDTQTYVSLLIKGFWAAIDAIKKNGKNK